MPLLDIILRNNSPKYQQGIFANGLTREDVLKSAIQAHKNRDVESLQKFMIDTLMWGDYNAVVANRYRRILAPERIQRMVNEKYAQHFYRIMDGSNLKDKFNAFRRHGQLKIPYIGISYFTKFLFFYSWACNQKPILLIYDKWTAFAWAALLLENRADSHLLVRTIYNSSRKVHKAISATRYADYIQYITRLAQDNKVTPQRFEELMFGWDKRNRQEDFVNPRLEVLRILHTLDQKAVK